MPASMASGRGEFNRFMFNCSASNKRISFEISFFFPSKFHVFVLCAAVYRRVQLCSESTEPLALHLHRFIDHARRIIRLCLINVLKCNSIIPFHSRSRISFNIIPESKRCKVINFLWNSMIASNLTRFNWRIATRQLFRMVSRPEGIFSASRAHFYFLLYTFQIGNSFHNLFHIFLTSPAAATPHGRRQSAASANLKYLIFFHKRNKLINIIIESKHFRGMLMRHAEHCSPECFHFSHLHWTQRHTVNYVLRLERKPIRIMNTLYVDDYYDAQLLVHLLAFHLISSLFHWCARARASARRW